MTSAIPWLLFEYVSFNVWLAVKVENDGENVRENDGEALRVSVRLIVSRH